MNGKCEVKKSILSHDREVSKQDFKDKLKNEYRHKKANRVSPYWLFTVTVQFDIDFDNK